MQDAAHPFFDGDLPALPNELADGDDARDSHSAHQDHEDASHIRQAQLVRGGARLRRVHLGEQMYDLVSNYWKMEKKKLFTRQAPPPRFSFHQRVFRIWSLPSSWSLRIAPLIAVLNGESEKYILTFFKLFICLKQDRRTSNYIISYYIQDLI